MSTRVDIETYSLYFRICMRVFTYIAPAMRPGGSSNRITVKENQIMYTVKPIIYTYTHIYNILDFLFPNQTDEKLKKYYFKRETFTTTKEVKEKTTFRQYMLQIIYRYETCQRK